TEARDPMQMNNYLLRRPNRSPARAAAIVPTHAPTASQICVYSREFCIPPVSLLAQVAAHWVEAHVPRRAIPESPAASSIRPTICRDLPVVTPPCAVKRFT